MKIISKYKDYYDYLAGVWGIDEKLILDRTKYHIDPYPYDDFRVVKLFICDYLIEGILYKGEYLYGEEVQAISYPRSKTFWLGRDEEHYTIRDSRITVLKDPKLYKREQSPNTILDCPILVEIRGGELKLKGYEFSKFPILKNYNVSKVFPPEKIWLMLSEWLGREKVIINKQTDKEKIISKGFDIKTSFRKM